MDLKVGDIVITKKKHPCGADRWQILRTGMDIRSKCLGCGRQIMLPRTAFEKRIKKVLDLSDDI